MRLKDEWDQAVDTIRAVTAPDALTQANVIGMVNEASNPEDVVVCAAGGLPGDLLKLWRPVDPKGYHLEYGYSCMGYEIAGGLGVKLADPSREVFVMVGDGSYLMLHTEIVTSLQEHRKLVIVLVDNSGFGCIRGLQMANGTPSFGNELRYRDEATSRYDGPVVPVDFVANAESLGAHAIHAGNEQELREALGEARAADRTTLISVRVSIEEQVPGFESWWDVPVAEVSEQASVQAARAQYEEHRKKQRVFV
jgi:3D-(3,5/4)-trihydroxycyclohexane-1,2-dione acylhydrolase (decyclizing)